MAASPFDTGGESVHCANDVERASRLFVLASTSAALLTYVWLVDWIAGARWLSLLLFAASLLLARRALDAAMFAVAISAFALPGLLPLVFGTTDFHALQVWLAVAAGLAIAGGHPGRWATPRPWRGPIVAWALVVAATWAIVALRELDFSLVAARTLDTPNGVGAPSPRQTAAWVAHNALSQLVGLLWFDLLWSRFGEARVALAERRLLLPLIIGGTAGAVVAIYQGLVDISWLNGSIWPRQQRAGGLMLDANSFGISAAMCAPMALAWSWRTGRPTWQGLLWFGVLAAGLWFAGSRTALLAIGGAALGVAVALADRRGAWHSRYIPIGLLLGSGLLVVLIATAPRGGSSSSPLQRIFDRLPAADLTSVTRFVVDEMWTRFGYGPAAIQMIREFPVAGVGVASFHVLAPDYIFRATGRVSPADNAQNWWRHQLAELGVVGALPALAASVLVLGLVWRSGESTDATSARTVLRGALAGLGLASLLGVPVQHPAMWLLTACLIYWTSAMARGRSPVNAAPLTRAEWVAALVVLVVAVVSLTVSARDDLRVPIRAQRLGFPYLYGFSAPQPTPEGGELRTVSRDAVMVFAPEGRWLALTLTVDTDTRTDPPAPTTVTLDDRVVFDRVVPTADRSTRYVFIGDSTRLLRLEVHATGWGTKRAVQVGRRWLRDLPPGASDADVVRE